MAQAMMMISGCACRESGDKKGSDGQGRKICKHSGLIHFYYFFKLRERVINKFFRSVICS